MAECSFAVPNGCRAKAAEIADRLRLVGTAGAAAGAAK